MVDLIEPLLWPYLAGAFAVGLVFGFWFVRS